MTFKVNYDNVSGVIVSYQEGSDDSENLCPEGCSTLSFTSVFAPMWDSNGNVVMKVDVVAKQLVFTNPVMVPQPI